MLCLHTEYKKGKGKETCKYLHQIGFFFGHCPLCLVWNAFIQMGLRRKLREYPRNNTRHACSLLLRNYMSPKKHHCILHPLLLLCHLTKSLTKSHNITLPATAFFCPSSSTWLLAVLGAAWCAAGFPLPWQPGWSLLGRLGSSQGAWLLAGMLGLVPLCPFIVELIHGFFSPSSEAQCFQSCVLGNVLTKLLSELLRYLKNFIYKQKYKK